jgi:hypothetical protein
MKKMHLPVVLVSVVCCLISCSFPASKNMVHIYEIKEIVLSAKEIYENPYTDVVCWVRLEGPGFDKKVYGFWDGGQIFKVRVAATAPLYLVT